MTAGAVARFLPVLAGFIVLLAPVGYATLRACGRRPAASDLGLALGLGYAIVPGLFLAELRLGGPWLVLPTVMVSVVAMRRDWQRLLDARALARMLVLPLLLAGFGLWVNGGDVSIVGGEVRFRHGWDVFDRSFYAALAGAVRRAPPPDTENPLFAGVPVPYSYFPILLGLLLQEYSGASLVPVVLVHLPALGLFLLGLLTVSLAFESFGAARPLGRLITVLLVVLGGDLSWLMSVENATELVRTRHFFVFHSWSAQALLVNAWGLGTPIAFATLLALHRFLDEPRPGIAVCLALLSGALLETRIFALAPLLGGVLAAGLLLRSRPTLGAGAAMALGCLPWVALTLLFPARGDSVFLLLPLAAVRKLVTQAPLLAPLARQAEAGPLPWAFALAAGTVLVLLGGLGVRLLGVPRLLRACRTGGAFHAALGVSMILSLSAGLLLIGNPLPADGMQFLTWAQLVLWLYAAPTLTAELGRRRVIGASALAAACVAPSCYVVAKALPERLTPIGAPDRQYDVVSREELAACLWLGSNAAPADRVLVPLFTPADPSATRVIRLALLADRGMLAAESPFSVSHEDRLERQRAVREFYGADDEAAALEILERWNVRWVWEDAMFPLRVSSPRLKARFASGTVRLYEVE